MLTKYPAHTPTPRDPAWLVFHTALALACCVHITRCVAKTADRGHNAASGGSVRRRREVEGDGWEVRKKSLVLWNIDGLLMCRNGILGKRPVDTAFTFVSQFFFSPCEQVLGMRFYTG